MTKSFEKNIDDLKFQVELGITETISANNREDINKVNSLEINSNLEQESTDLQTPIELQSHQQKPTIHYHDQMQAADIFGS